ncbi:MAG: substrate-binding domain-containing protein [Candidatus Eisenbacteria bacterium]|nr:substrate-binding domain-containing protein [Candidatus Eisenbacteria bacterium]
MKLRLLLIAVPLLIAAGCHAPRGGAPAGRLTAGRLRLVAAESARTLARSETAAFLAMYRRAEIDVRFRNTRGAVAALFEDSADAILIPREIAPEEDSLARAHRLRLKGFRVALDGVALIVHPSNAVNQVALDQLREVYSGGIASWDRLGGADRPIGSLWRDPNAGSYELMVGKVLGGAAPGHVDAWIGSDSQMVAEVARRPDALGFVGRDAVRPGVRVLKVSEARGFPYYAPDADNLWNQKYPLRNYLVMVYRMPAPPVADGFATYALSNEGQRVALEAGLVPTAVPLRVKGR